MDVTQLATLQQLLDIVNAGGVTAVLITLLVLFFRGDVIPRKLYERLLRDTLSKIAADIICSVTALLKEQDNYSDKQVEALGKRFNRIEAYIEKVRDKEASHTE